MPVESVSRFFFSLYVLPVRFFLFPPHLLFDLWKWWTGDVVCHRLSTEKKVEPSRPLPPHCWCRKEKKGKTVNNQLSSLDWRLFSAFVRKKWNSIFFFPGSACLVVLKGAPDYNFLWKWADCCWRMPRYVPQFGFEWESIRQPNEKTGIEPKVVKPSSSYLESFAARHYYYTHVCYSPLAFAFVLSYCCRQSCVCWLHCLESVLAVSLGHRVHSVVNNNTH